MHATRPPCTQQELDAFATLQASLEPMFQRLFTDPLAPRTVVVVPSLSLDERELRKVVGVHHYEERMLCMLMLLRLPRTELVYVTSTPIDPTIIDYYLHLLAGIPFSHARARLHLFDCQDTSLTALTQKILARPRMIERIQGVIKDPASAHLSVFNVTPLERTLAVRLGVPLYGTDPAYERVGTKSGSREVFREAGVQMAPGFEDLGDMDDAAEALTALKRAHPALRRAVVKLEKGFSGEGNAIFAFEGAPQGPALRGWVADQLPSRLRFEAADESWESYSGKYAETGGIVEAWIEGEDKRSPSVQGRVWPNGRAQVISTHDQILGGPSGQIFLGASFPAREPYRMDIHGAGVRIGEVCAAKGALGRFGVDFVSVPQGEGGFDHYAIEINVRKGGTTHPFLMLQYLTDGAYDPGTGLFKTPAGEPRYYYASDNHQSATYKGLLAQDLIDIIVCHGLHFHGATQTGVVFHLIGALSQFGKLGLVAIGTSPQHARGLFREAVEVLDLESRASF